MRFKPSVVVLFAVIALGLLGTHAARAADRYEVASWQEMQQEEARRFLTLQDTTAPAPGVNRWDCKPSVGHPNPVVLVHGLNNNQYNNWAFLGPSLANEGFCVFSLNHGGITPTLIVQGTLSVDTSAAQIARFIDQVLAATGATQVELVGHSLGGFVVEYTPKVVPGLAAKIDKVVAIAPPTHGVFGPVASIFDQLGIRFLVNPLPLSATNLLVGSPQQKRLHDGPIAQPGIGYTVFASSHDTSISPETAFFYEPGVTNVLIQDVCPDDRVGHSGQSYDSGVVTMIQNVLDPGDPKPVVCVQGLTS